MLFPYAPAPLGAQPLRFRPLVIAGIMALIFLTLSLKTAWLHAPYAWLHNHIYAPVRTVIQLPLKLSEKGLTILREKHDTEAELLTLKQENQELRAQVQLLGHFQAENRRLRMLMDSILNVTDPVLIAELSDTTIDGYRELITINKGAKDGVYVNQAVIDPYGLVGQVVEVFPSESQVMLITDGRSRVPVYISRTQQRALITGSNGYGMLEMSVLRGDSDIQIGDQLMSSGLGGVYPRGYPVAEITAIERDPRSSFMSVKLKPLAHLQSMLEVLLLDQRSKPRLLKAVVPVGPPPPTSTKVERSTGEKDDKK